MVIDEKFNRRLSRIGSRATYGQAILSLAETKKNLIAISADLGSSSGLSQFKLKYPKRFINIGIAEQNMIGVASGLAKLNYIVFASSFAPFISMRASEQIRMNLGYMKSNVKAVAIGSGVSMAMLGNSHFGLEDASIMRSIPNIVVLSPADCVEIFKVVHAAADYIGPVYIRLTGAVNFPVVYKNDYKFIIGKAINIKKGKNIAIIATGSMVYESIQASNFLEDKGMDSAVFNMHTLKPIDKDLLDDIINDFNYIITVEEHSIIGGLGSAVAEYISYFKNTPPLFKIGLPDRFVKTGEYSYLLEYYKLKGNQIANNIVKFINQLK